MPTVTKIVRSWMKNQAKPKNSRWANETHNGVPNQFYRNAPWRYARQRQLEKQPLCEHCLEKKLMIEADTVDHIKPIRLSGDPLDESNLMSLCKSCHARKSANEGSSQWGGVGQIPEQVLTTNRSLAKKNRCQNSSRGCSFSALTGSFTLSYFLILSKLIQYGYISSMG